ncbi:VWA domain-containing protein [Solirubrobacter ginsenosidimutans]|uniref:VWA domain-containing protein n=1 Tax=Solirubrobacter ginsenosidimutans TaxID=490573 RepID=A0A9X3MUS0_9ACTN|nr:VWA domain-containing protein [Solirubrobacter ginsenosidimutans]MDA0160178.1 VWA domain-containing protein [Solirubrobacter ginsenosidimutans]
MSFQAPLFLIGLVAIPLALLALWAARRRPAKYVIRFPATATLAAVVGRTGRARRIIPPALLSLSLAGLVTALARPEATIAVPIEKASVMLVTDTSGSMNATDVSPTRLGAAQAAATHFLDRVPKSLQTGLVAYADGPNTVLRPTQDRDTVKGTLNALQADGGTATGDALEAALNALGKRGKNSPPAAIVLLSDGASKTGRDPNEVAQEAKAAGVPIYTVALGTPDGVIQQGGQVLNVAPDPQALAQIAQLSGGRAFTAEDSDALDAVYQTLGSKIGTKKEKKEVSAGFAAFGLLLLGGAAFTSLRWRGRLP